MAIVEYCFYYAIVGLSLGMLSLYLFITFSQRIKFIGIIWSIWILSASIFPNSLILIYNFLPDSQSNLYYVFWQVGAFSSMASVSILFYLLIILDPDAHNWLRGSFFWLFIWLDIVLTNVYNPETVTTSQELGVFIVRAPPYSIGLFLIACIPFFYAGFRFLRKKLAHIHKQQEKFGDLFLGGFILILVSYPLSLILGGLIIPSILSGLFLGTLNLGGIFVGYAIVHNRRVMFLIPNMCIEMSVFHKSGVKLLAMRFRKDFPPTELRQGIIIGLQGLLTDLLGNDIVQEIKLKDRHVLLIVNQRLGYLIILATTQIHRIMEIFLQEVAHNFERNYQNVLQEHLDINKPIDPDLFKEYADIIQHFFVA